MRIEKLTLKNFRGFEGEHEVHFHPSLPTIFVGVNGSGKTSVLDGQYLLWQYAIVQIFDNNFLSTKQGLRWSDLPIGKENSIISIHGQFVEKDSEKDSKTFTVSVQYRLEGPQKIVPSGNRQQFTNLERVIPVCRFFKEDRFLELSYLDDQKYTSPIDKLSERGKAFFNCGRERIYINQLLDFWISLFNVENTKKIDTPTYTHPLINHIWNSIDCILQELSNGVYSRMFVGVDPNNQQQRVIIQKGEVKLDFFQLSSGEKMIIGMALDLAYRMSKANPMMDNPMDSPGVVLIDEPELHLHPRWQSRVLLAFQKAFPNIQFAVATHSPLILNHTKSEQLRIIDDFKIIDANGTESPYGKDVNAILNYFMGVSSRPVEVAAQIREIEQLFDEESPDLKTLRRKLNELEEVIGPSDYRMVQFNTLMAMEDETDYETD